MLKIESLSDDANPSTMHDIFYALDLGLTESKYKSMPTKEKRRIRKISKRWCRENGITEMRWNQKIRQIKLKQRQRKKTRTHFWFKIKSEN